MYTIFVNIVFLTIASLEDIKRREVSNNTWKTMVILCMPAIIFYLIRDGLREVIQYIISAVLISAMAIALYLAGLIMGGDAKGIIALSLCNLPGVSGLLPVSLLTFMNGAISTLLVIPIIVFWNLYVKLVRGISLFEGYHVKPYIKALCPFIAIKVRYGSIKDVINIKYAIIERTDEGQRTIRLTRIENEKSPSFEDDEYVWAMPLLPFLLFLLIGYILSIKGVNLAFRIVMLLMSH